MLTGGTLTQLQPGTETESQSQSGVGAERGPARELQPLGPSLERLLRQPNLFLRIYFCVFFQAFETSARRLPQTSVSGALALLLQPWPAPGTVGDLRGLSTVHLAGVTSPFWPLIPYL